MFKQLSHTQGSFSRVLLSYKYLLPILKQSVGIKIINRKLSGRDCAYEQIQGKYSANCLTK